MRGKDFGCDFGLDKGFKFSFHALTKVVQVIDKAWPLRFSSADCMTTDSVGSQPLADKTT